MYQVYSETARLINGINNLFSPEERQYLESERGDHKLTIVDILLSKFHDQYPIYSYEKSIACAHQILQDNQDLFLKIKQQYEYSLVLSNPDAFNKERNIVVDNQIEGKNLGFNSSNAGRENLTRQSTTSGLSERAFDYKQMPIWQREHAESLESNIQLNFSNITSYDIDKAQIKTVYDEKQTNPKPFINEKLQAPSEDEVRDTDYLNELNVALSSTKLMTKRVETHNDFSIKKKVQDKKETHTTGIKGVNVMKTTSIELPQLRNRFFNMFNCLFSEFLCQY